MRNFLSTDSLPLETRQISGVIEEKESAPSPLPQVSNWAVLIAIHGICKTEPCRTTSNPNTLTADCGEDPAE